MQVSARWHHVVATAIGAIVFALLYQVTAVDSRYAARQAVLRESSAVPSPVPGSDSAPRPTARRRHRVRRLAADGGGGCRPGVAAGRLGHPGDRPAPVFGHLHDHGHGPHGPGAAHRLVHVELHRGARVRPPGRRRHGAAARLEPRTSTSGLLPSRPLPQTTLQTPKIDRRRWSPARFANEVRASATTGLESYEENHACITCHHVSLGRVHL